MTPEFKKLDTIARRWMGTPFRPDVCVCGRGVDCKFLVLAIIDEWLGRPPAPPKYFINPVSRYSGEGLLEAFGRFYGDVYEAGTAPVLPGDVLTFRIGRMAHTALAVNAVSMIHVWQNGGVLVSRVDEFAKRLVHVFHLKSLPRIH